MAGTPKTYQQRRLEAARAVDYLEEQAGPEAAKERCEDFLADELGDLEGLDPYEVHFRQAPKCVCGQHKG